MPRDKVTRTFLQMFNIFVDQRLGADLKKFVAFAWNSNGKIAAEGTFHFSGNEQTARVTFPSRQQFDR